MAAAGEQKPVIQKSVQPNVFFMHFFQQIKTKKKLPKVHQVSPTVQPWLFFTRIR
jgi:hypothetical protein